MSELQKVFNYGESQVRTVLRNEDVWFVLSDVCKVLGLSTPSRVKNRLPKSQTDFYILEDRLGRKQATTIINYECLKIVIARSRSHKAINLAKILGVDVTNVFSKEQETINIISESFAHLEQIRQFHVKGYYIDFYFPQYKLAIECDEYNHKDYRNIKENEREEVIKSTLGCKFIRFNPDDVEFNIGTVINKIMLEIFKIETITKVI